MNPVIETGWTVEATGLPGGGNFIPIPPSCHGPAPPPPPPIGGGGNVGHTCPNQILSIEIDEYLDV